MKMKILPMGDSWASAVCATPQGDVDHRGWPQIIGSNGWATMFYNGVMGSTAAQWAMNFDNRLEIAKLAPADVCIVSLLGNDVIHACESGDTAALTMAALTLGGRALTGVVNVAKKPRTLVMIYADPFGGKQALVNKWLPVVNAQITKSVAGIKGVEIFDTAPVLAAPGSFNGVSGHPTAQGHIALATAFKQRLGL